MRKKKRDAHVGDKYVEYGEFKKPFKVVKVWGHKVFTSNDTVIARRRFLTTKYYRPLN